MKNLLLSAALVLAFISCVNAESDKQSCYNCKQSHTNEINELVNNAHLSPEEATLHVCGEKCK